MKVFLNKFKNKSLEFASKFGSQKHLTVIRDAFALLTPLIIAGAMSVLIRSFIFGGAGGGPATSILGWIAMGTGDATKAANGSWSFNAGTNIALISKIGNFWLFTIAHATIDMMSIFVAFLIGYLLTKTKGSESPIIGGLVALGSFLIAIASKSQLMGAQGLITAIIISILSAELYVILEKNKKLQIKMPAGVPPAVSRSFAKLFPSMIILVIVVVINLPFVLFGELTKTVPEFAIWGDPATWTIGDAIYVGVQSPFLSLIGDPSVGLGVAILFTFAVSLLWFFGLHGSNILMGIFSPIYVSLYTENVNGGEHIFVQGTFDAFIMIGGTGATFGFIVAVLFFARKNSVEKEISKIGLGPAIFQINEPVIFGVPMVLNIKYVIPFIFTMPILTVTTWIGFKIFSIHPVTIWIPWTTPVGVGGLLATAMDWKGLLLAIINFAIAVGIWSPFVMIWAKKQSKEISNVEKNSSKEEVKKEKKKLVGVKNA